MKRTILIILGFIFPYWFTLTSCSQTHSQVSNRIETHIDDTIADNKPNEDIKVNKYYDENGNLIAYDSTYFYSSNYKGDSPSMINLDSLFSMVFPVLPPNYHGGQGSYSNQFFRDKNMDRFFEDNLLFEPFIDEQMKRQMQMMKKMMTQMDSINQSMLKSFQQLQYQNKEQKKTSSEVQL